MATGSIPPRSAHSRLRRLIVGAAIAGMSAIVALPSQPSSACSIMPSPTVYVENLTAVLETGGPISDPMDFLPDGAPPEIIGAIRVEVIEEIPETADSYSGAVLQTTNVWGDGLVAPAETRGPYRKEDTPPCGGGNAPSLGASFYYLTTRDDGTFAIVRDDDDDAEVNLILDQHFGVSATIPDQTDNTTTVDTVGDTVDEGGRAQTGPTTVWLIVGAVGTLIVGIGFALSWRVRRRR